MVLMLSKAKRSLVGTVQQILARVSYRFYAHSRQTNGARGWVIGTQEVANMIPTLQAAVPLSQSAVLSKHRFYDSTYDYDASRLRPRWLPASLFQGWFFGKLAAWHAGIIYVTQHGFLRAQDDEREFEFSFLKKRGLGIVCVFTGSDIRSIPAMKELEMKIGVPNVATYLPERAPVTATPQFDESRRRIARIADLYADSIVTAAVDQRGYITRPTEPFRYFFPDKRIVNTLDKFDGPARLKVVHAPSSPIIKGTPLVRAAVDALRAEGFDFEYIELIGVSHDEVWAHLQRAHIVLNQFYAFMPGMFGVEAMAAGAVVLMSADENVETDLPPGSNEAWVLTRHHEIVTRFREALLAEPRDLKRQAARGQTWVREHASASVSGEHMRRLLDGIVPGSCG